MDRALKSALETQVLVCADEWLEGGAQEKKGGRRVGARKKKGGRRGG